VDIIEEEIIEVDIIIIEVVIIITEVEIIIIEEVITIIDNNKMKILKKIKM